MSDLLINDFVIKFANVNGSGSASANGLCAKAIFRMGVPISAKNIFPSNIQGLPTWYEIRANADGYIGRRDGIDLMVAMNPQTYTKDEAEVTSGGYLLYDNSWPLTWKRQDINVIGIPLSRMCAEAYEDQRQRQLFKNIVYLGALSLLINIDVDVIRQLLTEQFKDKAHLIDANMQAIQMGRDYVRKHLDYPLKLQLQPCDGAKGKILVSGNEAAGLGSVYAGATVCSWYPITPSTSLAENFEKYANKLRQNPDKSMKVAVIQAEDELSAVGMAVGANWNGARAFTATSGPGISLMSEFIGLAYFAEIPLVLFDIQRGGPSTGMPTRTQQSDVLACAYASHGDTKHVVIIPSDPNECFTMAADAFDLAEHIQTPVFVLSDLDIGMNDWVVEPFAWDENRTLNRGKVMSKEMLDLTDEYARYRDLDGDGIGYRTVPGTHPEKGAYFTRGTSHTDTGGYTEDGVINAQMLARIGRKLETAKSMVPKPVITTRSETSKIAVINYGSTDLAIKEALDQMASDGNAINQMRLRAFPFSKEVDAFIANHDQIFVVEQNRDGQMRQLLIAEGKYPAEKLVSVLNYDGMPLTAAFISHELEKSLGISLKIVS